MYQPAEQCCNSGSNRGVTSTDSVASICWPLLHPSVVANKGSSGSCPSQESVNWPLSTPWRRNIGQPRCGGAGRCQGDAQRCNSKYRYGVDDVGPCPSTSSCKSSFSCTYKPDQCPHPCPAPDTCNRPTTRCFEWPIPRRDRCPPVDTSKDFRPPRADLEDRRGMPECCPTCKRAIVDMACGPLGQNY